MATERSMLPCLQTEGLVVSDCLTLVHFELCTHATLQVVKQHPQAYWWKHEAWNPLHGTRVKEACTGLGGLGFGLSRVGLQTTVRNEIQPKTVQVLDKQGAVPVVPATFQASPRSRLCTRPIPGHQGSPLASLASHSLSWGMAKVPWIRVLSP